MSDVLEEIRYISLPAARTISRQLGLENITDDALSLINSFLDDFLNQLVETVLARKRRLVVSTARSSVHALLPTGTLAADCVAVADQMQQRTGFERGWPERPEAIVPGYVHERLRNTMLAHLSNIQLSNHQPQQTTNTSSSSNSHHHHHHHQGLDSPGLNEADTISGSTARYITGILEYIGRQLLTYSMENARTMRRDTIELEDATRALHFDAQIKRILDHMSLRESLLILQNNSLSTPSYFHNTSSNSSLPLSHSSMSSSMTSLNKPRSSPGHSPMLPPRAPGRSLGGQTGSPVFYPQSASTSNIHDQTDTSLLSSHTGMTMAPTRHSTDATMSSDMFPDFAYPNRDNGSNNNPYNSFNNNSCDNTIQDSIADNNHQHHQHQHHHHNKSASSGGDVVGVNKLRKYSADSALDSSSKFGLLQRSTAPTTPTSSTAPTLSHSTSNGALGKLFRQFRGKRVEDTSSPPLPSMPHSPTPSNFSRSDSSGRHQPSNSVSSLLSDISHGSRHAKSLSSVRIEPSEPIPATILGRSTSSEESDHSTNGSAAANNGTQGKRRVAALPLRLSKSQGDLRRKHNEPTSPKSGSSRDKMMEFEALISSTETKKMSLTPARMRTIESNDHKKLQPRDATRTLKKLFSSAANGVSGGSSKSRPLTIHLRRKGTSKSQPGSPTKPDCELPPMPSNSNTSNTSNSDQYGYSTSTVTSPSQSSTSTSSTSIVSNNDKGRARSKRAVKHVDRMEVLGEEMQEEATDEDSLPPTSRSQSPSSTTPTNTTPRPTVSRPLPVPPVKVVTKQAESPPTVPHQQDDDAPLISPGRHSLNATAAHPWVDIPRPTSTDTTAYTNQQQQQQQQQQQMDNTDLLVIDAPLCASSKSQSSLPSPRSIRSTRRTQSEDRNQAQRTSESSNERPSDSPYSTPPNSRTFADLEREHRVKMEASSSRSSSRNSNTKRSASTTNDLSAYTPIIRSVSSSAIDNESTTRSNTRSFSTGLPTMANEHTTATTTTTTTTNNINTILSHNEANIPLVKAASYNNASHGAMIHSDNRMSTVSVSSFVTANESMSGFRSRCTSDAADRTSQFFVPRPRNIIVSTYKDATTTTATSTTSQSQSSVHHGASALITPPGYESPCQSDTERTTNNNNSTSVDKSTDELSVHDGRPTPISVHNHDTIEQVLSSPSSSVISVSEITYSAHTDVTTPSYSGKLDNSSILSPRKTSPFSPLDSRYAHDTQVVTREKPELRRAYSYGSLSQPKPHRDFMQVDLSIWQSPDPQSPTQSSIASPGLEMQSTVPVDVAIPVKESSSNDKAALDQCNDMHHAESQQMIAQLQEQVANLQYQLASERAVRQELEELVTSLEQLRHKEIFGNNKTHRRVSASHRGSA